MKRLLLAAICTVALTTAARAGEVCSEAGLTRAIAEFDAAWPVSIPRPPGVTARMVIADDYLTWKLGREQGTGADTMFDWAPCAGAESVKKLTLSTAERQILAETKAQQENAKLDRMPSYDVEKNCAKVLPALYHECRNKEQIGYDALKWEWSQANRRGRNICVSLVERGYPFPYWGLHECISGVIADDYFVREHTQSAPFRR